MLLHDKICCDNKIRFLYVKHIYLRETFILILKSIWLYYIIFGNYWVMHLWRKINLIVFLKFNFSLSWQKALNINLINKSRRFYLISFYRQTYYLFFYIKTKSIRLLDHFQPLLFLSGIPADIIDILFIKSRIFRAVWIKFMLYIVQFWVPQNYKVFIL